MGAETYPPGAPLTSTCRPFAADVFDEAAERGDKEEGMVKCLLPTERK
jgi:hypothetical protein